MNLVIDIGNTLAKVAVFQGRSVLERHSVQKEELSERIDKIFLKYSGITGVVISNVSGTTVNLPDLLLKKAKVISLDEEVKLPFLNMYSTPGTLGNDRKALVAAAALHYHDKNVLVVDAGTCITFDYKDATNRYQGGAISPGIQMRFKALHDFTGKLPLVEMSEDFTLVGDDTIAAIRSGVINGVLQEIDGLIQEYNYRFGEVVVIVTGGDAQFLSRNLKNTIFANSNFLLEGLNHILEFNNSQ